MHGWHCTAGSANRSALRARSTTGKREQIALGAAGEAELKK